MKKSIILKVMVSQERRERVLAEQHTEQERKERVLAEQRTTFLESELARLRAELMGQAKQYE